MTIIRTSHNRENPYVILNKSVIQNGGLSLRARGLWALMMSYPNDWKFYVKKLIEECKEGRTAIYNTIDELIKARLMVRIQTYERNENGKLCGGGVEYIIFEFPISDEEAEIYQSESKNAIKPSHIESGRDSGFWDTGNWDTGNQQLLSNEEIPITEKHNVVGGNDPLHVEKDKKITKDDIYHYSLAARTDWTPKEIESAWEAYANVKNPVTDPFKYIDGIINKKRVIATQKNKESTKCQNKYNNKSPMSDPLDNIKKTLTEVVTSEQILGRFA